MKYVIPMNCEILVSRKWLREIGVYVSAEDVGSALLLPYVPEVVIREWGVELVTNDWDDVIPKNTEAYDFGEAVEYDMSWFEIVVASAMRNRVMQIALDTTHGVLTRLSCTTDGEVRLLFGSRSELFVEMDFGTWVYDLLKKIAERNMSEDKTRARLRLVEACKLADYIRTNKEAIAMRTQCTTYDQFAEWLTKNWGVTSVPAGTLKEICEEYGIKIGPDSPSMVDTEARKAVTDLRQLVAQLVELVHDNGGDTESVSVALADIPAFAEV